MVLVQSWFWLPLYRIKLWEQQSLNLDGPLQTWYSSKTISHYSCHYKIEISEIKEFEEENTTKSGIHIFYWIPIL